MPRQYTRRQLLRGVSVTGIGAGATTATGLVGRGLARGRLRGDGGDRVGDLPDVEGPVTGGSVTGGPLKATVFDLEERGYVEEEYFVSGEARPLAAFADGADGSVERASYKTRMLVYRPEHRWEFNGTLIANWPNLQPTIWVNAGHHLMREGYALAYISVQEAGVDDPVFLPVPTTWDPERYGDLHHPGDEYSYDIFTQAIRALSAPPGLRRRPGSDQEGGGRRRGRGRLGGRSRRRRGRGNERDATDPLDGLPVRTVLAGGLSQSAGHLMTYVNQVQETVGIIDGFLPMANGGAPRERSDLRDDLVPILFVNTEDESAAERRPDGALFRLWEVAGASHVNFWLSAYSGAVQARDFQGDDPSFDPVEAGQYGERADAVYGECEFNYYPARYAYRAALERLDEWVTRNREPPTPPRFEREDGEVVTDEFGNTRGGFRVPVLDVPVATYDARAPDCGLFGTTHRFDDETLAELYPSRDAYLEALADAVGDAVKSGLLLRADAATLLARARRADLPED